MNNYIDLIAACDDKIGSWNGYDLSSMFDKFSPEEVSAMIDYMSAEIPFDIDPEYFEKIKESSGYEAMRLEVVTNYIRRALMYMIDQCDTKNAEHWYFVWKNMYRGAA